MTDDDISTLFHRAVATIDTPTRRLVEGGLSRGRRRRLAVRSGAALTGAALVAAAAVLVAALVPGGSPGRVAPLSAGGSTTSISSPTTAAPTSAAPNSSAATVAMTPQALLQTFLDVLPRGVTTSQYAGNIMGGFAGTQLRVDDGHGSARVLVALANPASGVGIAPCPSGTAGCSVLTDGTHVQVTKGKQYTNAGERPNATEWSVTVVRSDGVAIDLFEYNAPEPKDAATTRALPPFSTAQIVDWLTRPAFSPRITTARAHAAATLFTPTDLGAGKTAAPSTPDRAQRDKNCNLAKLNHKGLPRYC